MDESGNPMVDLPVLFHLSGGSNPSSFQHTTTDNLGEAFTTPVVSIVPFHLSVSGSAGPNYEISCGFAGVDWVLYCPEDFGAEQLLALLEDPELLQLTDDELIRWNEIIDSVADGKLAVVHPSDLQTLENFVSVYAAKASPGIRKQIQEFQSRFNDPEFQRNAGFLIATRPVVEPE
jgi:hypothetical protein